MVDPDKASTEESKTGIEFREKPLNHSSIEFQNESIFDKNSLEVIAEDKNNFQTSIKGSSRTIPEDSMEDPGRASTEESATGIELHEKPLNHSLIEFQSEAILLMMLPLLWFLAPSSNRTMRKWVTSMNFFFELHIFFDK